MRKCTCKVFRLHGHMILVIGIVWARGHGHAGHFRSRALSGHVGKGIGLDIVIVWSCGQGHP